MNDEQNEENLVLLKTLAPKSYRRMQQYILRGKLTQIKTPNGIAIDLRELADLNSNDIEFKDGITASKYAPNYDYSNLIVLRDLDINDYQKINYYIKNGRIKEVKTPRGKAVSVEDLALAIETKYEKKQKPKVEGYKIDLSSPSRLNSIYRRLANMNDSNRDICQKDNKLKRYVDECGFACINLKDYCKPQIKLLAKKLECKESDIVAGIFDVLHKKYLKIRKQNRKDGVDEDE